MARGKQLSGALGDSYTVLFSINASGSHTKALTLTAETTLMVGFDGGATTPLTHAAIPFPCVIDQVTFVGEMLADADEYRLRVRRHDSDFNAAATDQISNSVDGSAVVDYVRQVATAVNQPFAVVYDGEPQSAGSTAVGFVEASGGTQNWDAGDYVSCTIAAGTAGDSVSHVQVFVTFVRDE